MSLEDLKQKIISDANAEANVIKQEAKSEIDTVKKEAQEKLSELLKEAEKEAERIAEEKRQNIITLARMNSKNKVLAKKQEIIEKVFEEAFVRLTNMTADEFRGFIKQILQNYNPDKDTLVYVGKKNKDMIDASFIDAINKDSKSRGKFVLADSKKDFDYGIYLITDWIEIDFTFEGLIKNIRSEIEMDIINILFTKGSV